MERCQDCQMLGHVNLENVLNRSAVLNQQSMDNYKFLRITLIDFSET